MPKLKRLSLKQRKFVQALIKHRGNMTEAAFEAYDTKSRKSAQPLGYQTMENPLVQEELERVLKKNGITVDAVTQNVSNIANEKDIRPSAETVLKANVELLKLLKAYPEKTTKHLSYSIKQNLGEKSFSELIELNKQKQEEIDKIMNS